VLVVVIVPSGVRVLRDRDNQVCATVVTVYRRERGRRCFGRKLDSGDGRERPRGARSGAPLVCGEGLRLSTELLDYGVGVLGPTAHPGLPLKVFLGVGRCQRL
jgi:hypothetical protein